MSASAPPTKRRRLSRDPNQPRSPPGMRYNLRQKTSRAPGMRYNLREKLRTNTKSDNWSAVRSRRPLCTQPSKNPGGETSQCYEKRKCDHRRHIGSVELLCQGPCKKWYHAGCLYDYLVPNVPFMISYIFYCDQCSNLEGPGNNREWLEMSEYADLEEVCVTALANLTLKWLVANGKDVYNDRSYEAYFDVKQIRECAAKCWLDAVEEGQFNPAYASEELTVQVLASYPTLFFRNPSNPGEYALREKDLSALGALNKDFEVLVTNRMKRLQLKTLVVDEHTDNSVILPPQMYQRFFRVELDPIVVPSGAEVHTKNTQLELQQQQVYSNLVVKELPAIPTLACRLVHPKTVTLSPMDCDSWLTVEDGLLVVSGRGLGSSTVRATHAVANGAWYFEATVLEHPPGSAVRIGWAQLMARADTSLGAQKNAYGWHSLTGKKVNDGKSQLYTDNGFGAGDVIGCLISLPDVLGGQQKPPPHCAFSDFLPTSHKNDSSLVVVDNKLFFEYQPECQDHVIRNLPSIQDSKIEFFKNGQPCGIAFEGLCVGAYYPAVSIFGHAKVHCNFGPTLVFPVGLDANVRPMADRAEQIHVEQAVSDLIENTVALSELF